MYILTFHDVLFNVMTHQMTFFDVMTYFPYFFDVIYIHVVYGIHVFFITKIELGNRKCENHLIVDITSKLNIIEILD